MGIKRSIPILLGMLLFAAANAANTFVVVQSTTSTQNSGLLDAILPQFTDQTGIEARRCRSHP